MGAMIILVGTLFPGSGGIVTDRPEPMLLSGREFRKVIRVPQSAFNTRFATLRDVVRNLSKQMQVAIVIDRRIDPTQQIEVHLEKKSLLEILQAIAKTCSAEAVEVHDFIYISPLNAAKILEDVSKARSLEMRKLVRPLPRSQRLKFAGRRTLHWNDLDEPRKLVQKIAESYNLKVESAERIPHDLWAGSTIPNARVVDQFTLILAQYDLTFQWGKKAESIRIVPMKEMSSPRRKMP